MPDIFLRQGQANPNDVKLFDPTASPAVNANVTAVAATATIQALTPTISADANVTAVVAAGTWAAIAASIAAAGNVTAIAAANTWATLPSAQSAAANVTAAVSVLNEAAPVPVISGDANLSAVPSALSIGAVAPSIAADGNVSAVQSVLSIAAPAPAVSDGNPVSVNVDAPVAVLALDSPAPAVSGEEFRVHGGGVTGFSRARVVEIQAVPALLVFAAPPPLVNAVSKPIQTTRISARRMISRDALVAAIPANIGRVIPLATVSADAEVTAGTAAGPRIAAVVPAITTEIIHRLAPQRFVIAKIEAEEVNGHWRIKKAA